MRTLFAQKGEDMSDSDEKTPVVVIKNRQPNTHVPTDEIRNLVSVWARVGTPQSVIAQELGISIPTLMKYYSEELTEAKKRGVAAVAATLYAKAIGGDTTSIIFYLKTQGRWREKDDEDEKKPDDFDVKAFVDQMYEQKFGKKA